MKSEVDILYCEVDISIDCPIKRAIFVHFVFSMGQTRDKLFSNIHTEYETQYRNFLLFFFFLEGGGSRNRGHTLSVSQVRHG